MNKIYHKNERKQVNFFNKWMTEPTWYSPCSFVGVFSDRLQGMGDRTAIRGEGEEWNMWIRTARQAKELQYAFLLYLYLFERLR